MRMVLPAIVLLAGCGDGGRDLCGLSRVTYECRIIASDTRPVVFAGEQCADISTRTQRDAFLARVEAVANAHIDAGAGATACQGRPLGPCDPTCPIVYDAGAGDRYPYR